MRSSAKIGAAVILVAVGCSGPSAMLIHDEAGTRSASASSGASSSGSTSTPTTSDTSSTGAGDSATSSGAADASRGADGGAPSDAAVSGDGCTADLKCMPTAPSTGDFYADCVARVNQFRACVCLPPLARWDAGESCANQDSLFDTTADAAHAGFEGNVCKPQGNAENECPKWGSTTQIVSGCLQQMFDEGPGTPYSAHGHFINMTNTSYKMVACGFAKTDAGVWSVQNFQ